MAAGPAGKAEFETDSLTSSDQRLAKGSSYETIARGLYLREYF
jgi:hypothetical protein